MQFDASVFRSLLHILSGDPESLETWAEDAINRIQQAQQSMPSFIEEYGDGEGYENVMGGYWTLDMGNALNNGGFFWQFVAFAELLDCDEETLIVAADDSASIWDDIVDMFEDPSGLELNAEVFDEDPEIYLHSMQHALNANAVRKNREPYRLLSLTPVMPDGAELYVALVRERDIASAIACFKALGARAVDAAQHNGWY